MNSCVLWLYRLLPVMSEGSKSGANWIRRKEPPMARDTARASMVLPTPGMSSNSTCPPAMSPTRTCRTA